MSKYDDIIVAVHGIGDQSRNETVRSIATRFARVPGLIGREIVVAPQPLGFFHSDVRGAVRVSPLDRVDNTKCPLSGIGFSEVFWADIPQGVVDEGRTMEETKAWARTVVSRARACFLRAHEKLSPEERLRLSEPDFSLATQVLEEIIGTVYVLENLCFLAEKAGVFKFDLREVLEKYLGDVQIVTEFTMFRRDIVGRFHRAMEQIHQEYPLARLHIVAHSEGTVISFLGLLHAMSGERLSPRGFGERGTFETNPGERAGRWSAEETSPLVEQYGPPDWLEQIHGYMTIGSPIDKHLLLWPELFAELQPAKATHRHRIQWRNYYDYGDPIGFKLDTARKWLEEKQCGAFEFEDEKHDIGFARYLLPGKAHNDYWADARVFEHFVSDVIRPSPNANELKPRTRPAVYVLSPLFTYVAAFLALFAGTLLYCRAVSRFMTPPMDPGQSYVRLMTVGTFPKAGLAGGQLIQQALGVTLLIAGTTLLARWPRLAKGWKWWAAGVVAFVLGCASYVWLVPQPSRAEIGAFFGWMIGHPTLGTLGSALAVALAGLTVLIKPKGAGSAKPLPQEPAKEADKESTIQRLRDGADRLLNRRASRRTRWFCRGMRPLITAGALVSALMVTYQVAHPVPALDPEQRAEVEEKYFTWKTNEVAQGNAVGTVADVREEARIRAKNIAELVQPHPDVWPVALAGVAFLYLWWLAALIFDLGFVWQRYVRQAVGLERMKEWRQRDKERALVP